MNNIFLFYFLNYNFTSKFHSSIIANPSKKKLLLVMFFSKTKLKNE
jgi:hypothetical protein